MKHSLPRLIVVLLVLAAPALAAERTQLPVNGLENRVAFWKKIYTQYGKDDIIIHDRIRVDLIYDVADSSNVDEKLSKVDHALKELLVNPDSPEDLSHEGRQIRELLIANNVPLSKSVVDSLIENVHTQRGIKERFRDGVVRSGRYVDAFREIMQSEGVIPELALLPLVESSFENAKSKVAALGVWQFTRGTGKTYLTINKKTDERLDPTKATRAAAKLLHDNYRALGSWPLAITAYNHGRGGMLHAKAELGPDITNIIDNYRGPVFGYASMNFYTEFVAAIDVYDNYQQYFGTLALDKPAGILKSDQAVVKAAAVSTKTPAKVKTASVSAKSKYTVRNGDSLYVIAQKFGTSIANLMDKNNMSKPAIYAGQILLVR
jgi:membrane-bound lytic murein transglycosylase D